MKNKITIDICLTPSMIDLFDLSSKKVIIIDVFRATSAMCIFLNNGGDYVIPVETIEEAKRYQHKISSYNQQNYLVAAERNGTIVSGFDLGNSPLLYDNRDFTNKSLVITTTNGTMAIEKAKNAKYGMLLASFLNASSVVEYLSSCIESDILIVCSGWKGRFCIEDLLLAGLLSEKLSLSNDFTTESDSVLLAKRVYSLAKHDLFDFLADSSYRNRMNLDNDVKYCLQRDIVSTIPIWHPPNLQTSSAHGFFRIK